MTKIDEKELQEIRNIRNNYQQIMLQLGQVELQMSDLNSAINQVKEIKNGLLKRYEELKNEERTKMDDLNKKYGTGNLNIETGVFTPLSNEQKVSNV